MKRLSVAALTAAVGLMGCFSLSKGEPLQRHYVLGGGPADAATSVSSALTGTRVGVRRLDLAAYLNTPAIILRQGSSQITFSEFHRWGEPLSAGISRSLAGALAVGGPFGAVDVAPWPLGQEYDYLIQLHILRFEGVLADDPAASEGEAHVQAEWEILRQADGVVLLRGTTDSRLKGWKVADYSGLVVLLDSGLHLVAEDLIAGMESLSEVKDAAL